MAQTDNSLYYDDGFTVQEKTFNPNSARDSLKSGKNKKIPKGLKVWTIDEDFGDITEQKPDTSIHNFSNYIFTTGEYGEYNTTGNLGAPRINRIATDRDFTPRFAFTEPYGYFVTKPSELRFTNTLSPITNLYYNSCGSHDSGEDHLKALFATNINKQAGVGFKFDYIYGRGYYKAQSTALFDYTMWASYLGERYQSHFIMSFDHMKNTENGGITLDDYITHPERQNDTYDQDEIPTVLSNNSVDNWNRNNAFYATLAHRYNVGFYKKVPMTEMEKDAKRFALKSQAEKDALKDLDKNAPKGKPDDFKGGRPTGRPDNAKVMGELSDSSIAAAKDLAKKKSMMMSDSLMAKKDTAANDTSWLKEVYVPVTSFIHTMAIENHTRTYIAYDTPSELFTTRYTVPLVRAEGDSLYDKLSYFAIRNRFAVALHEGLNKYIPMGAKIFIGHELRHYSLPASSLYDKYDTYNENNVSVGGQIIKTTGRLLHYQATVEANIIGEDLGNLKIDGTGDVNFRLFKDSVSVALKAFYHLTNPSFFQRHYHSKFFWWDNDDLKKQMQTHLEGTFSLARTRTTLRVAYDNLQNYTYLAESYDRSEDGVVSNFTAGVEQSSKNISLFTIALQQDLRYRIFNWENRITLQKSSADDILPVPLINIWTNMYIDFRIAKVLRVNLGAEAFFFTKYYAPEYCAHLGQYAVQTNDNVKTKVGGHPYVNVYLNCQLKKCRFFVMMSHINGASGDRNIFTTPHQPMNQSVLRLGLIWTFHN